VQAVFVVEKRQRQPLERAGLLEGGQVDDELEGWTAFPAIADDCLKPLRDDGSSGAEQGQGGQGVAVGQAG
jgi:hypothetical protein